jgi:hypothetical protein
MKVYILLQDGLFYGVFATDERAWTEQDRLRNECPWFKWEVFGSLLIG